MPHSMSWLPIRWSNSCLSRRGFCHHWGVKCQSRFPPRGCGHVGALGVASGLNSIIRVEWSRYGEGSHPPGLLTVQRDGRYLTTPHSTSIQNHLVKKQHKNSMFAFFISAIELENIKQRVTELRLYIYKFTVWFSSNTGTSLNMALILLWAHCLQSKHVR